MALGARRWDVVRMVLREVALLIAAGVAVGIPASLAANRLLESLLYAVRPTDPLTITTAVVIMLAVGAIAAFLPARRASRVDPMVALRYEGA
jgi:ABC-type antimicrobial peptide transport system permease subunit